MSSQDMAFNVSVAAIADDKLTLTGDVRLGHD